MDSYSMDRHASEPTGFDGHFNGPVRSPQRDNDGSPAYSRGLNPMTIEQLIKHKFEPLDHLLAPWLQTQGLTMIHAPRGVGKTHVSIGVACAVAAGASFLKWQAPCPRRVLFIDGEMAGVALQDRFARTMATMNAEIDPINLQIVGSDLEPDGLPDLASEAGQRFFTKATLNDK